MFCYGWTHDYYVSKLLLFAPNGTIIGCTVNAPGYMHDSQVCDWEEVYDRLENVHDLVGRNVVVDPASCTGMFLRHKVCAR